MSSESIKASITLPGLVYVVGEIDEELTAKVVMGIQGATEDLRVLISTVGGDVFGGMAIADSIRDAVARGVRVVGEVYGYCFSAGNLVLLACPRRRIRREAWLGIHGMTGGMGGDMRDLDADHAFNRRLVAQQASLYAAHSKFDEEYWLPVCQDRVSRYYNAEEALSAGLVDEVV